MHEHDIHPVDDVRVQHGGVHGAGVGRDGRGQGGGARGPDDRREARFQRDIELLVGKRRRQAGVPPDSAGVERDHRRSHRGARSRDVVRRGDRPARALRSLRWRHDPDALIHGQDQRQDQLRQGVQHLWSHLRLRQHNRPDALRGARVPVRR